MSTHLDINLNKIIKPLSKILFSIPTLNDTLSLPSLTTCPAQVIVRYTKFLTVFGR